MLYLANRKPAPDPAIRRAVDATDGYLYFNLPAEASFELSALDPAFQQDPEVLLARTRVLLHLQQWNQAEALSCRNALRFPDEDEFTVQWAFALHQLRRGDKAEEVLRAAPEWLQRSGILYYNLACYEARLGDLSTARQCIQEAFKLNSAMKKNARLDPDLEGLCN